MVGMAISRKSFAEMKRRGQKPRVLARAVVVDAPGRLAAPDQGIGRVFAHRSLRPAFERAFLDPQSTQPIFQLDDLERRPTMGPTGQGDFRIRELELVGGARFDQRQGLDRLDGRPWEDRPVMVAPGLQHTAIRIGDDRVDSVMALDQAAAPNLDGQGISHGGHYTKER